MHQRHGGDGECLGNSSGILDPGYQHYGRVDGLILQAQTWYYFSIRRRRNKYIAQWVLVLCRDRRKKKRKEKRHNAMMHANTDPTPMK
jgi:hypothetical protein